MKKLIYAAVLFALAGNANAAWFTAQIDRMQITPGGQLDVYFKDGSIHQCGSNRVRFVDTTLPGFKYIFAALLSYEAQKDSVQFLIMTCEGTTGVFHNIEGSPGI